MPWTQTILVLIGNGFWRVEAQKHGNSFQFPSIYILYIYMIYHYIYIFILYIMFKKDRYIYIYTLWSLQHMCLSHDPEKSATWRFGLYQLQGIALVLCWFWSFVPWNRFWRMDFVLVARCFFIKNPSVKRSKSYLIGFFSNFWFLKIVEVT